MAETKPAIAVVDPISTGAALARFLADQKYSVVRVFSDMCPDNIRALVKEGCEVDWAATVGKLPWDPNLLHCHLTHSRTLVEWALVCDRAPDRQFGRHGHASQGFGLC
jgi:hypothetical protein